MSDHVRILVGAAPTHVHGPECYELNMTEQGIVEAALRVAAEQYERDALTMEEQANPAHPATGFGSVAHSALMRVARQFKRQAQEARALADKINDA